ncbi:MAG TPA: tRNA uridine-5-carboxymethylaminomethyl(34) synthesis GTPase MnmE [Prevotellaceae bacterium]|nr:tRNA uridine-5-carboxymethylaminomethyl(34) synthesis GTPase MnmE [Prevotellaceae bacterium]
MNEKDTICALATAPGGAIATIRVSGQDAIAITGSVFSQSLEGKPTHTLHYGKISNGAGDVDDVLVSLFRAPHSYTGEDSTEISCHGSPYIIQGILELLIEKGARQALPGEFTQRAFLNGRLDLTQAEAVIDLIEADSARAVRNAAGQLAGALSRRIGGVYDALTDLMAHFCAVLDYPDEDLDPFRAEGMAAVLAEQGAALAALLQTAAHGRRLRDGVVCALVGRPNAGKSSLLNALLGYERAIVTDVPGTTRDTVEQTVTLGRHLVRLVDTAGIRDTEDVIEKIGVDRSVEAAKDCDAALFVVDDSRPLTDEDRRAMDAALEAPEAIAVLNKQDLGAVIEPSDLPFSYIVPVSCKDGTGFDLLEQAFDMLFPDDVPCDGSLLTNARQADAIVRAKKSVDAALRSLRAGFTPDAVLVDLEAAMRALGEVTGRTMREDITNRIFERFCVGK